MGVHLRVVGVEEEGYVDGQWQEVLEVRQGKGEMGDVILNYREVGKQ